ncbi:MAG TPA: RHS repeat-associated core domain-containing protein [Kofleriaceae bacterium]|nr:RHS repeat-associated core domain-containing protein [Kofleriaceae bacterium]
MIRDRQGQIVTELNLTAIPVDRPPFPVPDLGVPVYFTIQPGGAVLESVTGKPGPGARLFYPNFNHEVPGAHGTFWNYDPDDREWFVYGLGTISPDATQTIPDDGVVIHELTGAMIDGSNTPAPPGPPPCYGDLEDEDCGVGGDPVNLTTLAFERVEHDGYLSDVIPIDLARTYNGGDINKRAFGIGMTHDYDVFLYSQNQWQEVDVILPNGTRIHYVRTSPGTGYTNAVFQSSAPGRWHNTVIARNEARAGWDLTFRDGTRWFFPQFQPITEIADRNGNVLHIIREANNGTSGKVVQVISPNGRSMDFTYNADGLVSTVTDNLGRSHTYNYDTIGHLTSVVDPKGGTTRYGWDLVKHLLTDVTDARGNLVVHNDYDDLWFLKHQTLADGSGYDYSYTLNSCPQPPPNTEPSGGCFYYLLTVSVTDRAGMVRKVELDGNGHVAKDTFGLGLPEQQITQYEYTSDQLTAIVDPLGRRSEFQYDANGNLSRKTRMAGTALAASWNTTWDPVSGRPLTITDPNGNGSTVTYDGRGNIATIQNEPGQTWSYTYDDQGRRLTSTDPLGKVTTLAYDGADIASVTSAVGRQAQFLFDAAGRLISSADQLGNRTATRWDDLDGLLDITDALGGVTSFSHDANGNLLGHTDPKGHPTTYQYNAENHPLQKLDVLGKQTSFAYDTAGRLAQQIDARGQLQAITYDALGRAKRLAIGATPANPLAFTSMVENTWDGVGRLIQIVETTCADPVGHASCSSVAATRTITRAYDSFDHLTQEVTPQGEVDYTYDSVGRRLSMTIKNGAPGAQTTQPTVTYGYDAANRLTTITQAAGAINGGQAKTIAFTYDGTGRRTQTTLANGATVTYSYDDSGKLTAIVYRKPDGSAIGDLQYEYDAAGRRISMGGSLARIGLPTADVSDATYDAGDRLLTWAGKTYSYDDQGNLTSDGTCVYAWDDGNRLTSILGDTGPIASFQYDSLGRRTSKTINTTTTGFLYDHDNIAQELDGTAPTASVTAHLLSGATDQVFLRLEGNTGASQQSVLSDASNHTVGLIDASQVSSVDYTYEPYGATSASATTSNAQQYTGRENDQPGNSQGLYYYRARYYMPGTARFISADPIGWASGQTNNYAYAGGDPINFGDPSGFDSQVDAYGNKGGGRGGYPGWFDNESGDFDAAADAAFKKEAEQNAAKNAGQLANKGPRASSSEGLSAKLERDAGFRDFQDNARAGGVGDAVAASNAKTAQNLTTETRAIDSLATAQEIEAHEEAIFEAERAALGIAETASDADSEAGVAARIIQVVGEIIDEIE